jgi:hypothetical protein
LLRRYAPRHDEDWIGGKTSATFGRVNAVFAMLGAFAPLRLCVEDFQVFSLSSLKRHPACFRAI